MRYSANLLGLEKAAAREIDFGAIGRFFANAAQRLYDTNPPPGATLQELEELKKDALEAFNQNRLASIVRDGYQEARKNNVSNDEFIKTIADFYRSSMGTDAEVNDAASNLGVDPNEIRQQLYVDTSGRQLPADPNQLRYILHSQFGIPIDSTSSANIPFQQKLQAQNYRQLYPGLGVAAAATPLASIFSVGAGAGAGLGGAAGTLLGNYIADARGNHLADDMRNAGAIGSVVGSLGGAVGGHMLQNAFKKKKKED